jgi:hypothetical protein
MVASSRALPRAVCVERDVGVRPCWRFELWGRLVSLVSDVPKDYYNLYRQLNTTFSNLYSLEDARYAFREIFASARTNLRLHVPALRCIMYHPIRVLAASRLVLTHNPAGIRTRVQTRSHVSIQETYGCTSHPSVLLRTACVEAEFSSLKRDEVRLQEQPLLPLTRRGHAGD